MRTLYRAWRVHTLSYPAVGEGVLVDGRHVQRVGTGEPPEADRVVDLPGTTVMPGFIDTHVHLTGTGIHHRSPELSTVNSATELLAAVGRIVAGGGGGAGGRRGPGAAAAAPLGVASGDGRRKPRSAGSRRTYPNARSRSCS